MTTWIRGAVILLALWPALLAAQLDYTVSSGAQPFVPLGTTTSTVVPDLWGDPFQAPMPTGFSFALETGAGAFNQFRVRDNGIIQLGTTTLAVREPTWTGCRFCEDMIAPFLHVLWHDAATRVSYEWAGGVLTVEWRDVIDGEAPAGQAAMRFSFQVVIDTATRVIEYRYGSATGGSYAISGGDYSVSLTGRRGPSGGRSLLPGSAGSFVDSRGKMLQWPTDSYIRFTPTATTNNSPTVTVSMCGNTLPDMWQIAVHEYLSVADLDISISVGDVERDMVDVRADFPGIAGSMVLSEWESTQAAVPYLLEPDSGGVGKKGKGYLVHLFLTDAQGATTVIFFGFATVDRDQPHGTLSWIPAPVAEGLGAALKGLGHGACISSPGTGGLVAISWLLVLAAASRLRRRRA